MDRPEPRDTALREDRILHWVVQTFLDLWYSQDPCPFLHLGVLRLDRTISDGVNISIIVAAVSERLWGDLLLELAPQGAQWHADYRILSCTWASHAADLCETVYVAFKAQKSSCMALKGLQGSRMHQLL